MKIGIISDIHGNYPALQAVISELKRKECSKFICLGDVAGYYSMINECIDLLKKENVFSLKGNHDSYLLGEGVCPRSNSVNRCIQYQKEIITEENLKWISNMKENIVIESFCAMHGGLNDYLDEYINVFDFGVANQLYPDVKYFFSGHSHIQSLQKKSTIQYCNPGSVGQPRDGLPTAAYAIFNNGNIETFRIAYDIDMIATHMKQSGFDEYFYRNLYYGKKIGDV